MLKHLSLSFSQMASVFVPHHINIFNLLHHKVKSRQNNDGISLSKHIIRNTGGAVLLPCFMKSGFDHQPVFVMADSSEFLHLPSMIKFKIGLCQLTIKEEKNQNLSHALDLIGVAAEKGAKLVVLPEMWVCPFTHDHITKCAEDFNDNKDASPAFTLLSEAAARHKITIIGGSLPEWSNGRLYNTCCIFGPDGKLLAKHRKVHLFEVNFPGDICFKESDIFTPGDKSTVVETEIGVIGVGICHDLRFPEFATSYRKKGAHLICYPAAFNISTGELLWELSQRARAADNQLYVAGCSPSRDSTGSYPIWGHSTLVGPCGEIIATSGHEETVLIAEIDYSRVQLQRKGLPLFKQRREDVYSVC